MTRSPGAAGASGARALRTAQRTILIAVAASAAAGLALAACSGTRSASSAGSGSGAAPASRQLGGMPVAAEPAGKAARAGARGSVGGNLLTLSAQSIIYTAFLAIRVPDVTAGATAATAIVTGAGGYVSAEQENLVPGRPGAPQVSLQLKIPVAQYGPALAKLKALSKQPPRSFSQHAQNVTQQVADVNSRVASAQAAIRQLRSLLSHAGSVGELLSVQEEINSQEANLEALLAQQRALAHETSYATVSLLLTGHRHKAVVRKHEHKVPGFAAGLRGGWHALVLAVGWLLTVLGSVLPFAIAIAVIGAIAIVARRRLIRRRPPPAAGTAAGPPAAPAT